MSKSEYIRLRVEHAEAPYIHGVTTAGERLCVKVVEAAYMPDTEALTEGCTIMLIGMEDATDNEQCSLHVHRIIIEPDYLIDISSLAGCFSESGAHPMRYLQSLLMPKEITHPILLGNTANQFLDDCVNHSAERPASYGTSIRKAFRTDALQYAVCPDINSAFFREAQKQYTHIQHAVGSLHQRYPTGAQEGGAMLEPSFICPALGLQGRLDYLQSDLRCLVELKSGKADEYYAAPRGPKKGHTAQMMLYREMLHLNTGIPLDEIRGLLLYSRYPRFYTGDNHPGIVDEALVLRNAIVRLMVMLAKEPDTASLFESLTPETFNTKGVSHRLWSDYLHPQLSRYLAPFHKADSVTKNYVYRFMRFTAYEQYLSKVGRNERDRAQSHLWRRSNEEKIENGDIINGLTLQAFTPDDGGGYDVLTFALPPLNDTDVPNFRRGDIILFYVKERESDDASNRQVHKGTLLHIGNDTLRIGLRQHQHGAHVFSTATTYAMEHDVSDSVFSTLYRNLYAMLTAPQSRTQLLLGKVLPECDETQQVVGHYLGANTDSIVQTVKQAKDYALIVGAPGAGKTSIVLRAIVEEHMRYTECNILLMAYTNRAVDEICCALESIDDAPSYIRLGNEQSCDERYAPHILSALTATLNNREEVRSLINNTRIVVSTVSTAAARPELFAAKHFDLTLIDEASQILEPQLIGLLTKVDKFVLIGDHKQLPAISLQTADEACITNKELTEAGFSDCRQSLFERLHQRLTTTGTTRCIATLYCQGRMHPEVSRFANKHFYDERLCPVPLPHQTAALPYISYEQACPMQTLVATRRTAFIPCPAPSKEERFKTNSCEARLCASLVEAITTLYRTNALPYDSLHTIGIIAPFRGQGALIRHALGELAIPEYTEGISIDTVERYQGSQRDIIIYCTTVTEASQMELIVETAAAPLCVDGSIHKLLDRKLNVALTRARQQLFVIGIPKVLSADSNYRLLMEEL